MFHTKRETMKRKQLIENLVEFIWLQSENHETERRHGKSLMELESIFEESKELLFLKFQEEIKKNGKKPILEEKEKDGERRNQTEGLKNHE